MSRLRNSLCASFAFVGVNLSLLVGLPATNVNAQPGVAGGDLKVSAPTPQVAAGCPGFTRYTFVANPGATTTSTTPVLVPGASRTITTTSRGCIRITFSAQAFAPNAATDGLMFVQARLNGSGALLSPGGGNAQFVAESDTFSDQHTVVFSTPPLPAGSYTVQMFYSSFNGSLVAINQYNLSIDSR